jgi:hypothetical protein
MSVARGLGWLLGLLSAGLIACGGAQKPAAAPPSTASAEAAPEQRSAGARPKAAAEDPADKGAAEPKAAEAKAKSAPKEESEALAAHAGPEVEPAPVPKVDRTPAKKLRNKSRRDLDAAVGTVRLSSSTKGAAKVLTKRLGKPTWTENGKRLVWVAPDADDADQCHRLILEPEGSAQVTNASTSEWRRLAGAAQQNPCTGEIKR